MTPLPSILIPLQEIGAILAALVIFRLVAGITSPPKRRLLGAMVSIVVAVVLNVLMDIVASRAGWWWDSSKEHSYGPMWVYVAQQLLFSGCGGLIGWRIGKKWGMAAFCGYAAVAGLVGALRAGIVVAVSPLAQFGEGLGPRVADVVGWIAILFIAQTVMAVIAGLRIDPE